MRTFRWLRGPTIDWGKTPFRRRLGAFVTGLGLIGLAGYTACVVLGIWTERQFPPWGAAARAVLAVTGLLILVGCTFIAASRIAARHRVPHCPKCTFDMRGTRSGVCPECGHRTLRAEILDELAEVEQQLASSDEQHDVD